MQCMLTAQWRVSMGFTANGNTAKKIQSLGVQIENVKG